MYVTPTESPLLPLLGCTVLSCLFVGSLYVWPSNYGRNHPKTIKQRFCRVLCVVLVSPFIMKLFITSECLNKFSVFELIGLRVSGLLPAVLLPLLLTMVLFLGPLCMNDYIGMQYWLFNARLWLNYFRDLIWLRNVVIGPLSEEMTFRACMMPLLMQAFHPSVAIFVCSLFFGLAHVHHIIERYREGDPIKMIIISTVVQFTYTTAFGGYSAYLFIRTGHFVSLFVVHAFCNVMSFPDFGKLLTYENPKKSVLMCLFVLGVILWYNLLEIMTNNKFYSNKMYYADD